MKSRMEKYLQEDSVPQRSLKNKKLYDDIYEKLYQDPNYSNVTVFDDVKEIDIKKLKEMLRERDSYSKIKSRELENEVSLTRTNDPEKIEEELNDHLYDINRVLEKAKSGRGFKEELQEKNKLASVQYTFFDDSKLQTELEATKSKVAALEKEEKELINLIHTIAGQPKVEINTANDRTVIDESVDKNALALDILQDLAPNENTIVTDPIDPNIVIGEKEKNQEELEEKEDDSFATNSLKFSNKDFENDHDRLKVASKKSKIIAAVIVTMIVIFIVVVGYILINYIEV